MLVGEAAHELPDSDQPDLVGRLRSCVERLSQRARMLIMERYGDERSVEELAKEWNGKAKFLKLDADTNIDTTMRYQVFGLPTLILFKDGAIAKKVVGAMPKRRLEAELEPALA